MASQNTSPARSAAAEAFQNLADAVDDAGRCVEAVGSLSPLRQAETAQHDFQSIVVALAQALTTSTDADEHANVVRIIAECRDQMFGQP
ncbi:hypothetical protein N9A45_00235 [bacterium]|nr:hypothetical protein [bacterium]